MEKILIIEDNLEVRENLEEILHLSGYDVTGVENGLRGVEAAQSILPDLILCDVMMPELDGFGVLKILSKKPSTAHIPFIFLTAKADKTDFRKGMNLGADDYITKPFDDVELLDAIEIRLNKSQKAKQNYDQSAQGLNAFIDEARAEGAIQELSSSREVRHYSKKDILYQKGDYPKYIYYVAEGKVKTYKTNDLGKELIIDIYAKGDFIGHQNLIREQAYGESAGIVENAQIVPIPKEEFLALLYGNRDFSVRFIKMLAGDVLEREEQLLDLAYNSVRKRIADALLLMFKRSTAQEQQDFIKIRREDLAAMAGTAKETVIRTLSDFRDEGLIEIQSGRIKIIESDKLADLPI